MEHCASGCMDPYRASVYFTPQTKLVFLLATSQITSFDTVSLYILFQDASDTCNGPGVQTGIVLTLVVGEVQNRQYHA